LSSLQGASPRIHDNGHGNMEKTMPTQNVACRTEARRQFAKAQISAQLMQVRSEIDGKLFSSIYLKFIKWG
jgi:hypothetical protein